MFLRIVGYGWEIAVIYWLSGVVPAVVKDFRSNPIWFGAEGE